MIWHEKLRASLLDSLTDDALRSRLQFLWVYRILMIVSLGMTLVNVLTGRAVLGRVTFAFGLLCGINTAAAQRSDRGLRISSVLFAAEVLALFIFFIISGSPEGFSAIWICMVPTCGMLLYGRRNGTVLCTVMLAIVLFFFDTPAGNTMLRYDYTGSFKLRFPMLYLAFYAVSLFLETVRVCTQKKLTRAREEYRYLYAHDALTGLYNRYGFNELMNQAFECPKGEGIALLIVDADHFKNVNDRYGHTCGDAVLRTLAQRIESCVGGRGALCRWGGEEFAVLLNRWQDAETLGGDICRTIRQTPIAAEGNQVSVTVSVGAFTARKLKTPCIGQFVRRTDQCLYRAKDAGRDRVEYEILDEF